jgi:hypothetical protein
VLYTDVVSGPTSGGENGQGAYLSIFGKNFGNSGLGTTVKVTIGGAEVSTYRSLGVSRGRPDIEQISVQVGSLGGAPQGQALPIVVTVGGVASNADQTFMPNPGRFIYVDPAKGNDATGTVDDVTKPFKTVQIAQTGRQATAWGQVAPGDFIVLRAGTYQGTGFESYFMRFIIATNGYSNGTSGTAPTGAAGTGPITLMGYPGEDAFIDGEASIDSAGCLAGLNGENYPNAGKWIVIADLRIEGGGYDGPISQEIYGNDWRVVNNELTATTGASGKMAGITGNGQDAFWLGNHIHDIVGSRYEAHGIYIDGDGSYEIAYNVVENCQSGKGIQTYVNGSNGSNATNNVHIHHNVIHDTLQFGINVADGSSAGFEIYDNVVYRTGTGGLRFNTETLVDCKVYDNTFYDTDRSGDPASATLMNDWNLSAGAVDVRNNVFYGTAGTPSIGGSVGFTGAEGTFTNDLWFGGTGAVPFDTNSVTADPKFLSASAYDFALQAGSPAALAGWSGASSLVVSDYALDPRPAGKYDIGAFQLSK